MVCSSCLGFVEEFSKRFVDVEQGSGAASDTRCRSGGEYPGVPVSQRGRLGALSSREAPSSVSGDAFERSWRV